MRAQNIAQNPAGSQMVTIPSGAFQNFGSRGSHASFDSNGNLIAPSVTTPTVAGHSGSFGIANSVYNAAACGAANPPSWCSGTDIGGWVNSAFNNCSNKCSVYIPAGAYSYAATINIPVNTNGATALQCDSGAALTYTGTSYAIQALGSNGNNTTASVKVSGGCVITGTSSGLGGIHLRSFGGGHFQNLVIQGFTNGDGWFDEGANTVTCVSCYFQTNKNGIHNVGVVVSGTNYAPNATKFFGGAVASNSQWGLFEDASLSATAGPTQNSSYTGMVFENNGSNSNASASGQAFIQRCDVCSITNAYMEYVPGSTVASQITLGDSSNPVNSLMLINNFFGSTSGQINTINCVQCVVATLLGNAEEGNPINFFNTGSLSSGIYFGMNPGFAATHFIVGTGTFVFGLQGNNQLVSQKNTLDDGFGNANFFGNAAVGNGTNIVYRCTAAGAVLPVGALTTVSADCGAFPQDTGLRTR